MLQCFLNELCKVLPLNGLRMDTGFLMSRSFNPVIMTCFCSKANLNFKDEIPPPPDEACLLRIQGVQPPHPRNLKMTESERSASGAFRGVTQRKNGNWGAQISFKDAKLYLATCSTPEEAARVRDRAYYYLHGRSVGFLIAVKRLQRQALGLLHLLIGKPPTLVLYPRDGLFFC